MVSSRSFIVSVLIVGSLIYLQLIFLYSVRWGGVKINFPYGHPAALHIYWKYLFPFNCRRAFIKNEWSYTYFGLLLYSILFHLKYLSILPLVPHLLKVLTCSSVNVPHVLLKDCFRCLSALHFGLNFRMSFLSVKKKNLPDFWLRLHWLQNKFRRMDILTKSLNLWTWYIYLSTE